MTNWFVWFMIALQLYGCVETILHIGKPRDPISSRQAAITFVICVLIVVGLLHYCLK